MNLKEWTTEHKYDAGNKGRTKTIYFIESMSAAEFVRDFMQNKLYEMCPKCHTLWVGCV